MNVDSNISNKRKYNTLHARLNFAIQNRISVNIWLCYNVDKK